MNNGMEFAIKYGFSEMDFEKVTAMLKDAYWSIGIKQAEVIQGAKNSELLAGAFTPDRHQIGYARVISDKTRFAYILDVIVAEPYRRRGIGQAMVKAILSHPDLEDVYHWLLVTKDAHGVYEKAGFKTTARADSWMEIIHPRPEG